MQKRTNAVTNVEARYNNEDYDGVPANDELYAGGVANNDVYESTPESELSQSQVENVTSRFSKRFNERGVAKDVYRKTLKKMEAEELKQAQALLQAESNAIRATQLTQDGLKAKNVAVTAKKVRNFSGIGLIAAVFTAWLWQLLFGLISLFGFGVYAVIGEFNDSPTGKFIGWFVNLQSFIPAENLGFIFLLLGALFAVGIYVCCILFFYINQFKLSLSITAICFALSLFPPVNFIPWPVLWVLYTIWHTLSSK